MENKIPSEYSEYYAFLLKYRDELQTALTNEREKRRALLESNLDKLESVLSLQQAQAMKLQRMEEKRISLQGALGSADATAAEFIAAIGDEPARNAFSAVVKEMTQLAGEIKEQNSMALEIAKTNLKLIEKIFPANRFEQGSVVYSPDSAKRSEGPTMHSVELKF